MKRLDFIKLLPVLAISNSCTTIKKFEKYVSIDGVANLFRTGSSLATQQILVRNPLLVGYFEIILEVIREAIATRQVLPDRLKERILSAIEPIIGIGTQVYKLFETRINVIFTAYSKFFDVNKLANRIDSRVIVVLSAIYNGIKTVVDGVLEAGKEALPLVIEQVTNPLEEVTEEDLKL